MRVADVDPDSAAAERGIQAGDVILDAGGKPVSAPERRRAGLRRGEDRRRKAVLLRVKIGRQSCASSRLPTKAAS